LSILYIVNSGNMSSDLIASIKHARKAAAATKELSNSFAVLKIAIMDDNLVPKYKDMISKHNINMVEHVFPDSGFDLLVPSDVEFHTPYKTSFIDSQVRAEMFYIDCINDTCSNSAYVVHPRSSISKTPLMLANHTGVIDAGYRGNLIGAFRWLKYSNDECYVVEKHTRLLQVCHPSLCPVYVEIVNADDLSSSERGNGGFGSTGR